jgi:hypothetical protein
MMLEGNKQETASEFWWRNLLEIGRVVYQQGNENIMLKLVHKGNWFGLSWNSM